MVNKLVDINGLSRYHENLKGVLNTKQGVIEDLDAIRSGATAGAAALADAKAYADGLAKNYDAAGDAAQALIDAKAYVDGKVDGKFDAAGDAAQALTDAKDYVDGKVDGKFDAAGSAAAAQAAAEQKATDLNTAMNERVAKLEAIDHEKLALDASATAVAAIVAGAESDFDTLKEVADWINSDTTGAAALQVKVAENADAITDLTNDKQDVISDLETIRSGATAGATALQEDDLQFATDGDIDGLFA